MSKITIKIIDIDRTSNNIIVKYASESSANPIDDYSAMGFQITDSSILTQEQFIESIRSQVSQYVAVRDALEAHTAAIDFSAWSGYTIEVDAVDLPSSPNINQLIDGLTNSEIIL
jgi:hypothetical protein